MGVSVKSGMPGHERTLAVGMVVLVPIDTALAATLTRGPAAFEAAYRARIEADLDHARELVRQNLQWLSTNPRIEPWGAYLSVAPGNDDRDVIGVCAFVKAPDAEGEVEIAYGTFPRFENRGLGSATAAALIAIATARPEIRRVIAHTAPEHNASTRILQKVRMRYAGEATDKDIGRCWRWVLAVR
jgi:ribosomal-protein-alanine N-acetyltransferase